MIHPVDYGEVRFFRMAKTFWGRAIYWTGVYYVDGLLVDSGPPNLAHEVGTLVRELGVREAVLTHHHEDHSGNNRLLRDRFGIRPLAHSSSAPLLAAPETRPQLYRKVIWGVPASSEARPVGDVVETPSFRFEAIHTPGHASDHIVLFERRRRWLFTGDLYLGSRLKVLRSDEDVHALMESLRRAVALEPDLLFCQHRGRVENGTESLRRKLAHLEDLGGRIRELRLEGLLDSAIAAKLDGDDFFWRVGTSGHFSKLNFVRAFLASELGA